MKSLYEIFYAVLSGTSSPEERSQFDEFMKNKGNKRLFIQVRKIWDRSARISHYPAFDKEKAFYELRYKIEKNKQVRRKYIAVSMISVAASIILMIGIFYLIRSPYLSGQNAVVSVQTELGNRSFIVLPDSTKVWLNSQSKIGYGLDFGKEERYVKLSGEGFFEVAHSKKPFIVNVNDFIIKVYGTRFNVSAYAGDMNIFTSLESGRISLEKKGEERLLVSPGQLVTYNRATENFRVSNVNVFEYSAWKENKMYLHAEPLKELAAKLERKYNVKIRFKPESLSLDIHYTGVFSNENIEEVLEAISVASDLKYHKKGNEYEIVRKQKSE